MVLGISKNTSFAVTSNDYNIDVMIVSRVQPYTIAIVPSGFV